MSEQSIFTKIIRGEIPCHKVYEDDLCIAFLDIHPMHDGHTLVVPKEQIDHLWDLPDELYQHIWSVSKKLAPALQATFTSKRVGVLVDGSDVPHTHIHLIPFNTGMIQKQDMNAEPDHEKLAQLAEKIKENL